MFLRFSAIYLGALVFVSLGTIQGNKHKARETVASASQLDLVSLRLWKLMFHIGQDFLFGYRYKGSLY